MLAIKHLQCAGFDQKLRKFVCNLNYVLVHPSEPRVFKYHCLKRRVIKKGGITAILVSPVVCNGYKFKTRVKQHDHLVPNQLLRRDVWPHPVD